MHTGFAPTHSSQIGTFVGAAIMTCTSGGCAADALRWQAMPNSISEPAFQKNVLIVISQILHSSTFLNNAEDQSSQIAAGPVGCFWLG